MRLSFLVPLALVLGGCPEDESDTPADSDSDGADSRVDTILALDGDATEGEQVFLGNCASLCHGTDGRGKASDPSLLGEDLNERVPGLSDEEIVTIVLHGKGVMTAFDELLSDQEIADVVAFVRDEFGE